MKSASKVHNDQTATAGKRDVVIAYLSYALEDVDALSPTALYFLEMSIEALHHEARSTNSVQQSLPDPYH